MDVVERTEVVKVGVQGPRRIEWYEPHELNGREPTVFTVVINADGTYIRCGAYCVIAFHRPRYRGPRRPTHGFEGKCSFTRVSHIRGAVGKG